MIPVLTIAGSDSSGGAGIQADLKTIHAHGMFGMTVITAITAQNTRGVRSIHMVPPSEVTAQFEAILEDITIAAIKIGMLGDQGVVTAVADLVESLDRTIPIVLDPVMVATSGARLLTEESIATLCKRLIPLATVVTPNREEASVICEAMSEGASRASTVEEQVALMLDARCQSVVVTGGDSTGEYVEDLVGHRGGGVEVFREPRIGTTPKHGTGCTFSSAIAARLAEGRELREAIVMARRYVRRAIERAPGIGHGDGPLRHDVPTT